MDLEIDNIFYEFPDGTLALSGINLFVPEGTVHAIVGPSGCGKTTLLRVLAGVAHPSAGTFRFHGELRHKKPTAMVFQTPALFDWWTVDRNLGVSAEFQRVPSTMYRKTVDYVSDMLGLRHLKDRRPQELSLGEQTKVAFGRAFVHDADIMLLDEPFASLDSFTRRRMWAELETHYQLEPRSYLIVTHDVDEAITLADEISVMSGPPGRLMETIKVDVSRPRSSQSVREPGYRSAHARVMDLLVEARS